MLDCLRCKGTKIRVTEAFEYEDRKYPRTEHVCSYCNGVGQYGEVDVAATVSAIVATKGKNKGRIRASMTSPTSKDGIEAARAYYVWRMARFHGGIDVTMPMAASMVIGGDPYRVKLDSLADAVAKRAFGTDMAAALTWSQALGF